MVLRPSRACGFKRRPLGTPVGPGPVRVVNLKITMALVAESTQRALSEVDQRSAQGLLDNKLPRNRNAVPGPGLAA
jgi:hypothetical protein